MLGNHSSAVPRLKPAPFSPKERKLTKMQQLIITAIMSKKSRLIKNMVK